MEVERKAYEKLRQEEKDMSKEKEANECYYNDLIGLELQFLALSRTRKKQSNAGKEYAGKYVRVVVQKVSMHRKTKEPRFEIVFSEKKNQKSFVGFDFAYLMTYSDKVPLKYHQLKAQHIMKISKKAEKAVM